MSKMTEVSPLKEAASNGIDRVNETLNKISLEIWNHPELMFEERRACTLLTDFFENQGFVVERQLTKETAFRATYGDASNGPSVVIFCEYDALPDIGHGCGHNLIATAGVASAIGVKAALEAADKPLGKITLLGSPAEEGGGGKIYMIESGVMNDVDVAMMVHPGNATGLAAQIFGLLQATFKFYGKAAHAAAAPWEGMNALDAAVMAYQNVACMRQQMKPTQKVHGVISRGGAKPNIIPEATELEFYLRSASEPELADLKEKIVRCFKAAAEATGCRLECEFDRYPHYRDVIHNLPLLNIFEKNAVNLGVRFDEQDVVRRRVFGGSTDMGNVSYEVPSIHPFFNIGTDSSLHTRQFRDASGKQEAYSAAIVQAKAMAFTAIDLYTTSGLLEQIKSAFQHDLKVRQ